MNKPECSECDIYLEGDVVNCKHCKYYFCWKCVGKFERLLFCPDCGTRMNSVCLID